MRSAFVTPAHPPSIAELLPGDLAQLTAIQRGSLRITLWLLLRTRSHVAVSHEQMHRLRAEASLAAEREAAALRLASPARF